MSETVHYSGKLQRLNVTQDEYEANYGEPDYESFVPINGLMYEVIKCKEYTGDIFQAKDNLDGTIDFQVQYYNGGCGFSEALEYALNSIGE
jgi:hypothetical protein